MLIRTSSVQSKTTQRSQSVCSKNVESKYMGTLKVLDRKVSLQGSQPQAADSLRAAIYQVSAITNLCRLKFKIFSGGKDQNDC